MKRESTEKEIKRGREIGKSSNKETDEWEKERKKMQGRERDTPNVNGL